MGEEVCSKMSSENSRYTNCTSQGKIESNITFLQCGLVMWRQKQQRNPMKKQRSH